MESFTKSFFEMLGLPEKYAISLKDLQLNYEARIQALHPDRFVREPQAQKAATILASNINNAYTILKDPLCRAIHFLALKGVQCFSETNTHFEKTFLIEQMTLHEQLNDIKMSEDSEALADFVAETEEAISLRFEKMTKLLKKETKENYFEARVIIQQLKFYLRLKKDATTSKELVGAVVDTVESIF